MKTKSFLKRFLKGFIGGGIASAVVVLQSTPITSPEDLKALSVSLLVGFFTGGLLAIEKMLTWID